MQAVSGLVSRQRRFWFATGIGNTLLMLPILWLGLTLLAAHDMPPRHSDGSGSLPIAYAAQHVSLFSRIIPLSAKSEAHKFTVDSDYRLDENPPKDVHPSFYELFGTTLSHDHYHHIVRITQRWTREREQFVASGSRAELAVTIVAAAEATFLALLFAGLLAFVRKDLRAHRKAGVSTGTTK